MVVNNMKATLKILLNVIANRIQNGESFNEIIIDYPRLTPDEIEELKNELNMG